MARSAGIRWRVPPSVLAEGIDRGEQRFRQLLDMNMAKAASDLQAWAQAHHRWQNQTGQAEATFTVRSSNGGLLITLGHGVHYGIYLEYKHGGRWGVIPDALQAATGIVLPLLQDAVDGAWQ